jgi:predicted CoA-substrate-specific enzyme activase
VTDPGCLGVDIGSAAVSAALVDREGALLRSAWRTHAGRIHETLRFVLEEVAAGFGPVPLRGVGLTSVSPALVRGPFVSDYQVCLITACRRFFPGVRSILHAGGERFGLIHLDPSGAYLGSRTNSSCAAGTGSFLDQQARRLGLSDAEELGRKAMASVGRAPRISTRCAVFARTDLVHAQQAGHGIEEICDGVCVGVARNLADTLWTGEQLPQPAVFVGGVSRNQAVRRHLERILGVTLLTAAEGAVLGAVGAALCCPPDRDAGLLLDPELVCSAPGEGKEYFHPPLLARGSAKPRATSVESFLVDAGRFSARHPVETEVYRALPAGAMAVRMGIDVGSTSTKAMLVDGSGEPVAGFYTRTLGSPVTAVQALAEAIAEVCRRRGTGFEFLGVATTGSGRKLVGAILHADLIVDEISAHARAACRLDPFVDTIIEIGGQDAKFTTLRNGMVTFSHMNTVCAAGTGSFLEEQAARLGCTLSEYESLVRGARAPLSSDRCAVFMERDINTFLSQGYSREEILAAALFSVRENYLSKVARGASIGSRIAFQGATARNAALVEAFRAGLGKDIMVSRYCHLTGAWGAALLLAERDGAPTTFVGLASLEEEIAIRAEQCELCANHCRLRIAAVGGETVAYGFLCGRDYHDSRYVDRNRSGFDLLKERRKAFQAMTAAPAREPARTSARQPTIGLPAALALYGHLPLWRRFFSLLEVPVVDSQDFEASVSLGRKVQGAEFCAPIASLHGHVAHLAEKADWIFLPTFLEEPVQGGKPGRVHCYYTQFSSALAAGAQAALMDRCLMPLVTLEGERPGSVRELLSALHRAGFSRLSSGRVSRALATACREHAEAVHRLQERFREETARSVGPHIVFLGRTYNVFPPEMGKGIPAIFSSLGVKAFFQDMVPYKAADVQRIRPLLDSVHWLNAARTLEAACVIADTPGLYPVYVTSFKCSPDSIALEYFRRILDERGKPYLVLQLDDHDSTLGYETRIEAAVQSFRNHAAREREGKRDAAPAVHLPFLPRPARRIDGKTLLLPHWDPLVNPLLAANLRREGIDARLLEENPAVIRKGMRMNTGQCLPLSIIAQETADYVRSRGLDPSRTELWMLTLTWSCNLGMFIPFLQALLEAEGGGMEKVAVYAGDVFYREFSTRTVLNAYRAYLLGGLLHRVGCRLRPYETEPGAVDRAIARALEILVPAFESGRGRRSAVRQAASLLDHVSVSGERKPRVAIFGDLYVRDNAVMNQGLVHSIEAAGAEVIVTPYADYLGIIMSSVVKKMFLAGHPMQGVTSFIIWHLVNVTGRAYRRLFARHLDRPRRGRRRGDEAFVRELGLRPEHGGESFDNLLKIRHVVRACPDLALLVQASPAFCCPSIVTEAMGGGIERLTGVPVVSITYDGTGRSVNDVIVPYIRKRPA